MRGGGPRGERRQHDGDSQLLRQHVNRPPQRLPPLARDRAYVARVMARTRKDGYGSSVDETDHGISAIALAVGSGGDLFVTSQNAGQVLRYDWKSGQYADVFASNLNYIKFSIKQTKQSK